MSHININHDKEPVRLFKSDFLEFFTHITPTAVLIIWSPVVIYFLYRAILDASKFSSPLLILAAVLAGLFFWTFAEYTLHRFLFHMPATTPTTERISFLFHGIHHYQPACKTRLVMPPAVSIPMALLFYWLFWLIFGVLLAAGWWTAPIFAGFMLGYLAYDMIHYSTHHLPMRGKAMKFLKKHHMLHHMRTPDARFGVSSHLWDIVFKTLPADN
jgi:sterol desaturase/sphingolipid hydroxylase (fatty acid hydroxylase superfamily)